MGLEITDKIIQKFQDYKGGNNTYYVESYMESL